MAGGFIRRFLDSRAAASAKRDEFIKRFDEFLGELVPYSVGGLSHKDYRHAWRRAVILSRFYEIYENNELQEKYKQFALEASDRYLQKAPDTLYGKPPLKMGDRVWKQMVEIELRRLVPEEFEKPRARPLACIYIGKCKQGRVYVGQTVGAPELRWLQHRIAGTGPFKDGDKYVKWTVVEEEVEPGKLNEREAYYIGLYHADLEGYNETAGNDQSAYLRGKTEWERTKASDAPP